MQPLSAAPGKFRDNLIIVNGVSFSSNKIVLKSSCRWVIITCGSGNIFGAKRYYYSEFSSPRNGARTKFSVCFPGRNLIWKNLRLAQPSRSHRAAVQPPRPQGSTGESTVLWISGEKWSVSWREGSIFLGGQKERNDSSRPFSGSPFQSSERRREAAAAGPQPPRNRDPGLCI